MRKGIALLFLGLFLSACSTNKNLTGPWVQPIPGQENKFQGFNLDRNGIASSINMRTLKYEKWQTRNNCLILSGKSIGNRQTISFSDTLSIEKQSNDTLILVRKRKDVLDKIIYYRPKK